VLNIFVTVVLWGAVVSKAPTGWTLPMVIVFSLLLELWYTIREYVREIAWFLVEAYVFGVIEPLLRPQPLLYRLLSAIDGGFFLATLIKLAVFLPLLLLLSPSPLLGFTALLLGILIFAGFEVFVASASSLLLSGGSLWSFFYWLQSRTAHIPADFLGRTARFFAQTIIPVYFYITFPSKAFFGIMEKLPLTLSVTIIWLLLGFVFYRLALRYTQAYGG
jgi:hypothetical protein